MQIKLWTETINVTLLYARYKGSSIAAEKIRNAISSIESNIKKMEKTWTKETLGELKTVIQIKLRVV